MPTPFLCTPESSVKREGSTAQINAVRCKRWSCPHCAQANRRKVIALGVKGKPTAFLTLTVSSTNYETPDDAAADLKRGLVALRKRIARRWPGKGMAFLAVFEKHKSGWPHLHLLIRAPFMPVDWLKACWEEITGSYMVDIRKVDTVGKAAFYVAKYVGKDLTAFAHCKRWWRSHDWNDPANDNERDPADYRGWARVEGDPYRMAAFARHLGAEVTDDGGGRFTLRIGINQPWSWNDIARGARHWYGHSASNDR